MIASQTQQYQDVNYGQMEEIKEQIGQSEYEDLLQQTYEQLNDIINKQERDQFDNTTKLMDKYHIQDQSIKTNIYMVDSQILPQLKSIVQQLSKVKKDIEKQTYNEKPYQDKLQKLEQDIQLLEQEFKVKIQQFQIQEQDLNNKLNRIKEQIDTCQDQILLRVKPNKALLEQEILQLNNVLTSLQDQKQQLEGISNKSPPTRKSSCGILAISKSLNQFAKLRKQDIVSSSNSIVKGITPTKDTANLYLINKYSQNKSSSKQDNRPKQNFSMKAIK
ncbi:hypothetical protein pb186bvf_017776 [Paramecium bursaria]